MPEVAEETRSLRDARSAIRSLFLDIYPQIHLPLGHTQVIVNLNVLCSIWCFSTTAGLYAEFGVFVCANGRAVHVADAFGAMLTSAGRCAAMATSG